MQGLMKNAWSQFAVDGESHLQLVLEAVEYAFESVLRLSVPGIRVGSGVENTSPSVLRPLNEMLSYRKDLALHAIEDAIDEFRQKLFFVKMNALAPVRTAFIGRLMEDTYHAANLEYGKSTPH